MLKAAGEIFENEIRRAGLMIVSTSQKLKESPNLGVMGLSKKSPSPLNSEFYQ